MKTDAGSWEGGTRGRRKNKGGGSEEIGQQKKEERLEELLRGEKEETNR